MGDSVTDLITTFYQQNVYPHLRKMCFYHRLRLNHLEEHTNCGHEGTNNGIKHSAAPVTPMDRVNKTVATLSFNTEVKSQQVKKRMCQKTHKKNAGVHLQLLILLQTLQKAFFARNGTLAAATTKSSELLSFVGCQLIKDWVPKKHMTLGRNGLTKKKKRRTMQRRQQS